MKQIKLHRLNDDQVEFILSYGDCYYFDSIQDNIKMSYAAFQSHVQIGDQTGFVVIGKPGLVRLSEGLVAGHCDEHLFGKHDRNTCIICYEPRVIAAVILGDWLTGEYLTTKEINSIINPVLQEKEAIDFLKGIDCYHSERIWKIYSDPEHRAPITKFIPKEIQKRVERVLKARNK